MLPSTTCTGVHWLRGFPHAAVTPLRLSSHWLISYHSMFKSNQLWVLRSTLTLNTTDTTLLSVDGDNGPRGALVHLPYASPETLTEVAPGATVTLTVPWMW